MNRLSVSLFVLALAACGNGDGSDAGPVDVDMAIAPDLLPPLRDPGAHPPQAMITSNGGRVLKNPEIITIVWSGDALGQKRQQFADWLVTSDYFKTTMVDFGIGAGTTQPLVTITDPPPATFDESSVGPFLRAHFADGTIPPPNVNSLYVFYTPKATTPTMNGSRACSGGWLGYHSVTLSGEPPPAPSHVPFAIVPACSKGAGEFLEDTDTASHEIAEAATDPEITAWMDNAQPLSEVGDLCNDLRLSYAVTLPDGSSTQFSVQRIWSPSIAASGSGDPCVPTPGNGYIWFNAGVVPFAPIINTDANGKGTTTFLIEPFAQGNVGTISWIITDGPATGVRFSTTQGKGVAGSTQSVTITVSATAQPGNYPLSLVAYDNAGQSNVWWGYYVVN